MVKRTVWFVAAALLAGACSSSARPHGDGAVTSTTAGRPGATVRFPANAQLAAADVPRASTKSGASDVPTLVAGDNAFAFDLYAKLAAGDRDNLVFSPASISNAISMLEGGARGETLRQIDATLHFTLPAARLHDAFNALDQRLAAPRHAAAGENGTPLRLEQTDAVWGQRGYPFVRAYLDLLARDYGVGIRLADFERAAEAERVKINAYVANATHGRITELFPAGIIDSLTRMVLVNTIWFKGDWVTPFFPISDAGNFTRLDGSTVDAQFMHGAHASRALKSADYDAVELPYVGGASMVVIAPAPGRFTAVEQNLRAAIQSLDVAAQHVSYEVTMPKFKFTARYTLNDALEAMGLHDAFVPGAADLSGIGGRPGDLYLKAVVHQATITVDEKGTEAAAATGGIAEALSLPPTITVDHPFLFAIRDDKTGAILFAGRVLDPSAR